jgi:hypothetical protein
MATQKAVLRNNLMTVALTDEEFNLLQAFAAEQGIEDIADAIPSMIRELVSLHDQLWDAQFAQSTAPMDKKVQQALDDDRAGLTEDFDD